MIRQKKYPAIRKKLWGEALWSPSYFAGSCGGAPISVLRQYIEQLSAKGRLPRMNWYSRLTSVVLQLTYHLPVNGLERWMDS